MTVHLHALRYGAPVVSDHDSVDDAVLAAWGQVEDNTASPQYITDRDGGTLVPYAALRDAIRRVGDVVEEAGEADS